MHAENINKIDLSYNDDKRFVASNGIESYPYGYILKKKKNKKKKNIHYKSHIDLIKLLYTVLVNTFDLYNEYNICLASFFNLIELLPASI